MTNILIAFRLDDSVYNISTKIKKEFHATNKDIYHLGIREILKNKKLQKQLKDDFDEILINSDYRKEQKQQKNKYFRFHLPKNTLRRLLDGAYTSFVLTGKINMSLIDVMISDAEKCFEKFNEKERLVLEKEMLSLDKFRKESYLLEFMKKEARKKGENLLVFRQIENDTERPIRK